jgi:hypothetical protein
LHLIALVPQEDRDVVSSLGDRAATDEPPVETVQFGLWWPAADPAQLREAADAWRTMVAEAEAVAASVSGTAGSVLGSNDSEAVAGFGRLWSSCRRDLERATEDCRALARALDEYADAVDEARGAVMRLIAEAAAAVVIGIGLSVLTAGISAAGASAMASALVANAARVGIVLGMRAATIISRVAVFATVGSVEGMAADLVLQTRRHAIVEPNENPFQGYALDAIILSGVPLPRFNLPNLPNLPDLSDLPDLPARLPNLPNLSDLPDLPDLPAFGPRVPDRRRQQREFEDAVHECERQIGRPLSRGERRILHDEISGQGYRYHEIVEICVDLFSGRSPRR